MRLIALFGYLDPGTGSIVIQSVVGVVAGVGLFGRRMLGSLKNRAKSLFTSSKSSNNQD